MSDDTANTDKPKKDRAARQAARAAKVAAGEKVGGGQNRDLNQVVAKALWKVQRADAMPKESDARKELWSADKKDMVKQARKVVSAMEKAGITLSVPEKAPKTGAATED